MKKNRYLMILILLLLTKETFSSGGDLTSFAKSMTTGAFWKNMGRTFGAPPTGYIYSFHVISDANVEIYIGLEGIASFMGAFFPSSKGIYNKQSLPSLSDATIGLSTKALYDKSNYYFNLFMSADSNVKKDAIYSQSLTQLPPKPNDPNIYFYHAYTGKHYSKGKVVRSPKVEMLGFQNPSGTGDAKGSITIGVQLSALMLYNCSTKDVQVTLNYGPTPYTITLEKNSYNTLNVPVKDDEDSTPVFSLRPNTLEFSIYDEVSKKHTPLKKLLLTKDGFNDYTYTIELFDDEEGVNFCIQGLSPGSYDQMVTPRVRDITPCPCAFWYQSVSQLKDESGYMDLPGQVWVAYNGHDSKFIAKVEVGTVGSWNLIRPLLGQKDEYVYFVYVATLDDKKAKKFVEQIVDKKLGHQQVTEYDAMVKSKSDESDTDLTKKTLSNSEEKTTLTGNLMISGGVIEDKVQDVCGYIVGVDIFTPKGLGVGNFYYTLAPSIVNIPNMVQLLSSCVDSSKLGTTSTDQQTALMTTINAWLLAYLKDPKDCTAQVEAFLIKNGTSSIVKVGDLTKFGKSQLKSLVTGPVSLKYPPMKLSTVTNQYVYDFGKKKPDKMPKTSTPLQAVAHK